MARLGRSSVLAGALLLAAAAILTVFATTVRANPSDLNTTSTSAATTSPTYIIPGTATSTLTYDSYNDGIGDPNASESAVLLLQTAASSTSSVFTVALQYSQNGIDWYQDNLMATTTSTNIGTAQTYTFTAAGTATTGRAITVPTPTRYVRAVTSVAGANAAVWGQIVAKKQQPE